MTAPGRGSPAKADQRFSATGANGIEVYQTSGTLVENLTVRHYLTNTDGANGNEIWWNSSTDVAAWTQNTATQAAGVTMPACDSIQFTSLGIVGQSAIDWQTAHLPASSPVPGAPMTIAIRRSTAMKTLLKAAAVAITAAALSVPFAGPAAAVTAGPGFVHGVLPPPPAGSTSKNNQAAEPQIRADRAGNFYISSENGLGAGTDAWSSTDGGHTYASLPQPNEESSASGGTTGFAPGGGDTDLATAPAKSSGGTYNVYVASLTLGSVTVSLSQDGGHTWASDVTSAKVPGDDREWIAAAGAGGFYLSYHAVGAGDEIIVNQGQVAGGQPTTVQTYDAINPAQTDIYLGTVEDNEIGNIAVDPKTGDVYQVFVGCPPSPTAVESCAALNTAYMAVGVPSTTGGVTTLSFTDYVIYQSPSATTGFDNNFPAVAVDTAGNVYATWSNDQNVYLAHSTDHGQHWSTPGKVNHGSAATTAIYPWLTAGHPGQVDLVFYGTPAATNYQTCGQTGTYTCQNEPWSVFFAQNLNVLGGGSWAQAKVTPVVHDGGVCQGGVSCTSNGNDNRDLFDDFGVVASPATGLASITYSDDQYADNTGTANAGECTSAQNNTSACDHTDYATQTTGPGIY